MWHTRQEEDEPRACFALAPQPFRTQGSPFQRGNFPTTVAGASLSYHYRPPGTAPLISLQPWGRGRPLGRRCCKYSGGNWICPPPPQSIAARHRVSCPPATFLSPIDQLDEYRYAPYGCHLECAVLRGEVAAGAGAGAQGTFRAKRRNLCAGSKGLQRRPARIGRAAPSVVS